MKDKIKNAIKTTLVIDNSQSIDIAVEKIYEMIQKDLITEIHIAAEDLFLCNYQESYNRLKTLIEQN